MAWISELLHRGPTFSFEFFPPKTDAEQATLQATLTDLQPLGPSFVSVTYRGGRESRKRTHDLVEHILQTTTLNPMAHLVCVAHTKAELSDILEALRSIGVDNLMALGGDPPPEDMGPGELLHAVELVELAHQVGGFSVGVAAHPAVHPRSVDRKSDRDYLAAKMEVADFAVTQFFFEVDEYLTLVDELAQRSCTKPVLPGIMPVTALRSIPRMAEMGAAVPKWAQDRLHGAHNAGGDDAVRRAGVELATELCEKLLAAGAPGLHFYTLNRSSATREIYSTLGLGPAIGQAGD